MERRGLVLVVGMTGSGKTTSLASMVDHRNRMESGHIITIEDPVEYYHEHQKSLVTQREVGVDTHSYKDALKNALRQRPDVILVGEIRDREVMEQALACAESGHLCLATVHANNAYQAIERVINFFPDEQAHQVRMSLANNLKGVLSQRLLKSENGGMVPVLEILLNQGLVRELIQKGDVSKISDVMEKNAMMGMRTFDQSLIELYRNGTISEETAVNNADRPSELKVKLRGIEAAKKAQGGFGAPPLSSSGQSTGQAADEEQAVLGYIDTASLRLHD
jgi:twitching motility protein PilU